MMTMMTHAMTMMQMPEAENMMFQGSKKDVTTDVPVPLVMTMLTMMNQTVMMMPMPEMEKMTIMTKSRATKKKRIETMMKTMVTRTTMKKVVGFTTRRPGGDDSEDWRAAQAMET